MSEQINYAKVLEQVRRAWEGLADFRRRRRRYVRYTYGDQWSDMTCDRRKRQMTEGELYTFNGRKPLCNNLIRRMVKGVVGRYRQDGQSAAVQQEDCEKSGKMMEIRERNLLGELDARTLEEFLISGVAVQRVWKERRPGGAGVWVDAVSPDMFFVSGVRDSRCGDAELVGRLTDLSGPELMVRFGRNRQQVQLLEEVYGCGSAAAGVGASSVLETASADGETVAFDEARNGRYRVVEVWRLECRAILRCHDRAEHTYREVPAKKRPAIEAENRRRRRSGKEQIEVREDVASVWRCYMLTPRGDLLDCYDSPLSGGMHPFAMKLYPMVDGEVHSLVEDVIDQQRYVNRLMTMMDRMMATAAKGVLLFPMGCKPGDATWDQMAAMWADPGGVIPYFPAQGLEPKQVTTPVGDFGARELLETQIGLFEDVSGVSGALLGRVRGGNVGVERFESEVRASSTAVNDLLASFRSMTEYRDRLLNNF